MCLKTYLALGYQCGGGGGQKGIASWEQYKIFGTKFEILYSSMSEICTFSILITYLLKYGHDQISENYYFKYSLLVEINTS